MLTVRTITTRVYDHFTLDRARLAYLVLFMVAGLLRLATLTDALLWYDEAFTALVISKPLPVMMAAIAGDVHPPLFYLLLWPFAQIFGASSLLLRLPSVFFSLTSILLTDRIARKLNIPHLARWAALILMAIGPFELHFAQEGRMYGLLQVLVLAWLLAVLNRDFRLATLTGIAALYTHNYALFYLPVMALIGLAGEIGRPVIIDAKAPAHGWLPGDQANLKAWLLSNLIPALAWLPWQFILAGQMAHVAGGYWIQPVNMGSLVYALYMLFWGFYMPGAFSAIAVLVVCTAIFYAVAVVVFKKPGWSGRVLISIGLAPAILAFLASIAWRPLLLFRGLIPSAPMIYLLIASALVTNRRNALYMAIVFAPLVMFGTSYYYQYNALQKGNTEAEISAVRAAWKPGDTVVHVNDGVMPQWQVYAPDLHQVIMPECAERNLGALSRQTRAALGVAEVLPTSGRLWVLWPDGVTATPCEHDQAARLVGDTPPYLVIRNDDFTRYTITLINLER